MGIRKKTLLLAAMGAVSLVSIASASISLSYSITVLLQSGEDSNGFEGSTWTLTYGSSDAAYASGADGPYIDFDSVTLAIAGADNTDANGTFDISETASGTFSLLANDGTMSWWGYDNTESPISFTIADSSIAFTQLGGNGFAIPVTGGDPVSPSDFDGIYVFSGDVATIVVGDTVYGYDAALVNIVPEPATTAALGGLLALVTACWARRHRA